jgi:hypothetical protein
MSMSRSSTATSNSQEDSRVATDGNSLGISADGDVNVDQTAPEAWEFAKAFGTDALAEMGDLARENVRLAREQGAAVNAALDAVLDANQTETSQLSQKLIPAAAIVFIAWVIFR